MSTYFHLRCTAHTPYINSETIGNRCAKTVAEMYAERAKIVAVMQGARGIGADADFLLDEQNRTARFFTEHPSCPLELWDEYGKQWCLIHATAMQRCNHWICQTCTGEEAK